MDVSFWRAEDLTSTFTDFNFGVAVSEVFHHPPEEGLGQFQTRMSRLSCQKKLNKTENAAWNEGTEGIGRLRSEARPETSPEEFPQT